MGTNHIERSAIWADIRDIMSSGKKPVKFEYRGMLHTEKEDYPVFKIMAIDTVRDYANNIGDILQVKIKIALGEYISRLYPYRSNLEFTVKRILLEEGTDSKQKDSQIQVERYKAVFLTDENPVYTGSDLELIDTESLNLTDILDIKLQLLDRSLEPLRVKSIYGVFHNTTQKQLIHTLLAGESMKVQIDGKPSIEGINIVEPDNTSARKDTVLPNGTIVTNLPTFLQEKMGGVYSSGIGNYLQRYSGKKMWFVYPLYNHKRFDTSKDDKAVIYALPQDRFPSIDRSYNKDGPILNILANRTKRYQDSADVSYMNSGNGFRMADARSFMKKPVDPTEEGPKGQRANLNYEVSAEDRKDGLNYAPFASSGASSNPFKEYTKANQRRSARIDFIWENCDAELIYPGMPCKYVFMEEDKIVELKGIIAFVQVLTELQGMGLSGKTYRSVCTVTLITDQKPVGRKIPTGHVEGVF